jgi:hypothetical protein
MSSSQYYRVTAYVGTPHRNAVEVTLPLVGPAGPAGPAGTGLETLTTQGDTLYRGASTGERLPIGNAGQILRVNSGGTAPEWGNESGAVTNVNGETGVVVLDAGDVGALQSNFTHESFTYDDPGGTGVMSLPARRNVRWQVNFIVSGGNRTLRLPSTDVQVGDRIYVTLTVPANTTLIFQRPQPGQPITIATLSGGARLFYAAQATQIVSSLPVWRSLAELNAVIGAIPASSTSTGSTGSFVFADQFMYICIADDTWRRVPIADF